MTQLNVEDLVVELDDRHVVEQVSFSIREGEFIGLVGPNGSGKSSLLRSIYRVLKPKGGRIVHLSDDVWQLGARDAARRTAVVAQERMGEFDFTVGELVAMGRMPHKRMLDSDNDEDRDIVDRALRQVGMLAHAHRFFMSLSGGEKQRVLVARALAQQARFLVLDEPTNHLDIRHQLDLLELVRTLGTTTLAALHDLGLAARYCDRLIMLSEGRIVAEGKPDEVLAAQRIRDVYKVDARVSGADKDLSIEFFPLTKQA